MNGYLLDPNVALLAASHSASLSVEVRKAMERGANYLSVVVYGRSHPTSMKGAGTANLGCEKIGGRNRVSKRGL